MKIYAGLICALTIDGNRISRDKKRMADKFAESYDHATKGEIPEAGYLIFFARIDE